MLKAILFDLDDTLLDWSRRDPSMSWEETSYQHMKTVFQYVCENLHPLEDEKEFVKNVWGRVSQSWVQARQTLTAPHMGKILLEAIESYGIPRDRVVMDEV